MNLDTLFKVASAQLKATEDLSQALGLSPEESRLAESISAVVRAEAIRAAFEICGNVQGRERRGLILSAGLAMALRQSEIQNQSPSCLEPGEAMTEDEEILDRHDMCE